jgi:hypothetical protein
MPFHTDNPLSESPLDHRKYATPTDSPAPYESDVVDVTSRTLLEVLQSGDEQLSASVRRLVAEVSHRSDVKSGWSNFVDDDPIERRAKQ